MEFSLRRQSFRKPSLGSSSFKHQQHQHSHQHNSSYDSSNPDYNDDDDHSPGERSDILSHHHNTHDSIGSIYSTTSPGPDEVIVKIESPVDTENDTNTTSITTIARKRSTNARNSDLWRRGSSGEFSFPRPDNDDSKVSSAGSQQDPASKLIGQFLEQQKEAGEMSLDMDLDMEELQRQQNLQHQHQHQHQQHNTPRQSGLPPLAPDSSWSRNASDPQSPDCTISNKTNIVNYTHPAYDGSKEIRVSFQESLNSERFKCPASMYSTVDDDSSSDNSVIGDEDDRKDHNHSGEVLRRNSNNNMTSFRSFRRMPSMSKTKSRLMDPPSTPLFDQQSVGVPRSGQIMRSGLLGKSSMGYEDDDDPFFEDDLPDQFKHGKINTVVILEWVSLVMIVGAFICTLILPVLRKNSLWKMKLWKWEVLVLVLICGRLVSDWGIRIIVFLIERNFLLRKRVLYFVYGLKKAVQNVIWLGLVLLTWRFLFDRKVEKEAMSEPLKVVTKLLVIGEVGAILWLLKTLLVKVCASTFHVNAFFDRIQESLFNQFVIETLSAPPLFEYQEAQAEAQEEEERTLAEVQQLQSAGINVPPDLRATVLPRTKSWKSVQPSVNGKTGGVNTSTLRSPIGQSTRFSEQNTKKLDEGITIDHLHKLSQKNVSAWNMKRLMKIIRHGTLTTLDEHIVDTTTQEDESTTQIRSEVEAKAAARKIFRNVARSGSRHIHLEDLMHFMREDEALKTMSLFEGANETEKISKSALKNWVVNTFRERRALALTLSDTKTAVNKLHKMVNVIVSIIIILIGVIWLNIISTQSILVLSSQVVVVAFVFGNTCKNVFESIIFLFVIHPFDVGDRCEIDNVQLVVEEMNILTTVFLRYDNQKVSFPNYILLTKPIGNFYRSPDMGDGVEFLFHIATPAEKIAQIRQRILSYIEYKKEHWYPSPMIILKDGEGLHMLRIAVWLQHRMNHQDMGERYIRRALLIEECVKIFRELDIEYRTHPVNVSVNSMPALPDWSRTTTMERGKEVIYH